jgi:multisubunit Na+/H+ antiporter MnhE subunit
LFPLILLLLSLFLFLFFSFVSSQNKMGRTILGLPTAVCRAISSRTIANREEKTFSEEN